MPGPPSDHKPKKPSPDGASPLHQVRTADRAIVVPMTPLPRTRRRDLRDRRRAWCTGEGGGCAVTGKGRYDSRQVSISIVGSELWEIPEEIPEEAGAWPEKREKAGWACSD